jgi:aspartate/methionine/tyrosine aminotransferase
MTYSRTHHIAPYMEYAKLYSSAKYNLATSGIKPMSRAELGASSDGLEINAESPYGNPELQGRIAAHCGVSAECIVPALGTSMANHLALAACFEPGEDVLVEHPTYEPLLSTARFLGANIIRFERPAGSGFRIDVGEIERVLTPRTRLIVLCNLHNPTSVPIDNATLQQVGDVARSVGARVLVDEVYLEAIDPVPPTAFLLGEHFVVTNSLTKGYGLSGLRCGWIIADPELVRRVWRIYDVFAGHNPYLAEALSVFAFDHLDRIRRRAQDLLNTNRAVMNAFLRSRDDLECKIPEHGTTAAPRLKHGTVEQLDTLLREKYETAIVPGRFFEMPQHFRVGIGADPEMTRIGFERLAAALDELKALQISD